MNVLTLIGFGTNLALLWMVLAWIFSKNRNNASWVDVAWSYGFLPVTMLATALASTPAPRALLLIAVVACWSLRLGTYLAVRVRSHEPAEDPRYAALRVQFPKRPWFMFFAVYMMQAILIGILSIPMYFTALNTSALIASLEWIGAFVVLASIGGETIADAQLKAFKKVHAGKKMVCNEGLWKFSRHPNYFFEWLVWVGLALMALPTPWGWASFLAPAIMYYLLTKVTGIPPAEAGSLKSRGDSYRAYQESTSAFIPWFPKSPSPNNSPTQSN